MSPRAFRENPSGNTFMSVYFYISLSFIEKKTLKRAIPQEILQRIRLSLCLEIDRYLKDSIDASSR